MKFSRSYGVFLAAPPLLVVLPLALWYLNRVISLTAHELAIVITGATVGYLGGAVAYVAALVSRTRAVEQATDRSSFSDAISACLRATAVASGALWIGWGLVMAIVGSAVVRPGFFAIQCFVEAALLIAAPAMAWAYWAGKWLLLRRGNDAPGLRYTGRPYTIGLKIAIVFIGFFGVSVGALVQLIASHIGSLQREGRLSPDRAAADIAGFGVSVGLVTTVIFSVATYLLARDISAPMKELTRFAGTLAAGRLDGTLLVFADDQIGGVADKFAVTRENLRELVKQIGSSGRAITSGVRTMSGGTDTLLEGAQEQTGLASSSSAALVLVRSEAESVLGAVDHVSELTHDSAATAMELRASSGEVAERMEELFLSVEKTSSSIGQIDASARETSKRTNEVSAVTSEALSFVSEMDATIEQIHRTSEATASLSNEVRENALAGRRAVNETMEGIRSAQESTRRTAGAFESLQTSLGQIDQILALIEELTNRTNLLSFNAAIIAAQAGANDYGFSVIADEVRQLADRTRGATKEISTIIRSVQPITRTAVQALGEGVSRVDETVDMAQGAEAALARILASADRSLDMARSITTALQDQTRAARRLHETMARMSDNVTEIHRATAGQAEATRLLAAEAERVRDIALQVTRAAGEQTSASSGIAAAMEQVVSGISVVRNRLDHQRGQADEVASASRVTLAIAEKNNAIAAQFSDALAGLLKNAHEFEEVVGRFTV